MHRFVRLLSLLVLLFGSLSLLQAQAPAPELKPIALPAPSTSGGMPVKDALRNRKTTRLFSTDPFSLQQLSDLLWAGFGINRPAMSAKFGPINSKWEGMPGRTAASAHNDQEIEIYAVLPQGAFLYDAKTNQLLPVVAGDLRPKVGMAAANHAAVTLVYVSPAKNEFAGIDTGFIAQNIYLWAASEGLNSWIYAFHNQDIAGLLHLPATKEVVVGHSLGFPPK